MAVVEDPDGIEKITLHQMVDLKDQRILEIGCGNGRLTWRYADQAALVTAIDPDLEEIETARANLPDHLKDRVSFIAATIDDFARSAGNKKFDVAIFAWSL
jgi:2-polyprenyl-3-methyl-5-hydroxy-6-metoxy-1,4-benzoquinol methylase